MTRDIARLESLHMRAWPALRTDEVSGWQARRSGRYSRRGNSVFTHDFHGDLAAAIADCEALYAASEAPAIFRVTEQSEPAGLDAELAARGYQAEGRSLVMVTDAIEGFARDHELSFAPAVHDAWLERYFDFNQVDPALYQSHRSIVRRVPAPACFGQIGEVALGLAVVTDSVVSFHDVVVAQAARGKGNGRRIMCSLLVWGREQGASSALLAVEASNVPAIALYESLGFRANYEYWYRRRRSAE